MFVLQHISTRVGFYHQKLSDLVVFPIWRLLHVWFLCIPAHMSSLPRSKNFRKMSGLGCTSESNFSQIFPLWFLVPRRKCLSQQTQWGAVNTLSPFSIAASELQQQTICLHCLHVSTAPANTTVAQTGSYLTAEASRHKTMIIKNG